MAPRQVSENKRYALHNHQHFRHGNNPDFTVPKVIPVANGGFWIFNGGSSTDGYIFQDNSEYNSQYETGDQTTNNKAHGYWLVMDQLFDTFECGSWFCVTNEYARYMFTSWAIIFVILGSLLLAFLPSNTAVVVCPSDCWVQTCVPYGMSIQYSCTCNNNLCMPSTRTGSTHVEEDSDYQAQLALGIIFLLLGICMPMLSCVFVYVADKQFKQHLMSRGIQAHRNSVKKVSQYETINPLTADTVRFEQPQAVSYDNKYNTIQQFAPQSSGSYKQNNNIVTNPLHNQSNNSGKHSKGNGKKRNSHKELLGLNILQYSESPMSVSTRKTSTSSDAGSSPRSSLADADFNQPGYFERAISDRNIRSQSQSPTVVQPTVTLRRVNSETMYISPVTSPVPVEYVQTGHGSGGLDLQESDDMLIFDAEDLGLLSTAEMGNSAGTKQVSNKYSSTLPNLLSPSPSEKSNTSNSQHQSPPVTTDVLNQSTSPMYKVSAVVQSHSLVSNEDDTRNVRTAGEVKRRLSIPHPPSHLHSADTNTVSVTEGVAYTDTTSSLISAEVEGATDVNTVITPVKVDNSASKKQGKQKQQQSDKAFHTPPSIQTPEEVRLRYTGNLDPVHGTVLYTHIPEETAEIYKNTRDAKLLPTVALRVVSPTERSPSIHTEPTVPKVTLRRISETEKSLNEEQKDVVNNEKNVKSPIQSVLLRKVTDLDLVVMDNEHAHIENNNDVGDDL